MTRKVYRYEVPVDDEWHRIMLTSLPLPHVEGDTHTVEFWAEHNDAHHEVPAAFRVFGTGHAIPAGAAYVGTAPRLDNGLVWHLYQADVVQNNVAVR